METMSNLSKLTELTRFTPIECGESLLKGGDSYLLNGDGSYSIEVDSGVSTQLIIVNGENNCVNINIGEGSKLKVIELNQDSANSSLKISQNSGSELNLLSLQLNNSKSEKYIDLVGENILCRVNSLDMISGEEETNSNIVIKHSVPKCESAVQSKILVSKQAKAELRVRAYVAQDAQQSVANQSLRGIELNDGARAKVWPELEIYADDVQCSHGATMGQVDSDAIFYMRQRGLSLEQARRVQMEGFISDVVHSVLIDGAEEVIEEIIREKFNTL